MPHDFDVTLLGWAEAQGEAARIRREVFVVEQGVPEALEWDGLDADALHALARSADGEAIGTGRLLPDGHIGRMAVVEAWRGRGVGAALLDALVALARRRGLEKVELNAQTYALGFYARTGFEIVSDEFQDAGIPHRTMALRLR